MPMTTRNTLTSGLNEIQRDHPAVVTECLTAAGEKLIDDIRNVEPRVPVKSGALSKSFDFEVQGDTVTVFSPLNYAPVVEYREVEHKSGEGSVYLTGKIVQTERYNKVMADTHREAFGD